ncbi:sulfatase-like hydrolase/transferase [Psychrobacter celer]
MQPLQTETVENPPNIVFLVIDSWREETFNAENTPNLWNFAQNGTIYQEHLSTGNATRAGVFGFFYGIPSTYWHSAIDNKTSPVFIDRMQELDYQLGIFASARLTSPEFDQTVFLKVPDLRKESTGDTAVARDQNITEEWLDWFEQKDDSKPSFSFLFYDAPHGYAFPEDYDHRYEPMLSEVNYLKLNNNTDPMPLMNRYKTSVHFIDSLAKQVLNALSASGEMENTIVVITGDHGEELNDNKQNYWGHNGNFSNPQVHVPFAIIGKGVPKNTNGWNNRFTSHQDVVPTLMQNYLGVKNPVQDYSMGVNLLGKPIDRDWLLVSSYSKYAVVTHKDIMEVGSVGQFSYVDKKYKPLKDQPDYELLQQALEQISRFSK